MKNDKVDVLVVLSNLASRSQRICTLACWQLSTGSRDLERLRYDLECLTQAPTNTAPTHPSMPIRVFKDTMSSHLVSPCFFSASSSARVYSRQGTVAASFPPSPSPSQVAVSYCQGIILLTTPGASRRAGGWLPAQHSARPHPKAALPGQTTIARPWKGPAERAPRATWPPGH